MLAAGYAAFSELLNDPTAQFEAPETAVGAPQPDRKRHLQFGAEVREDVPAALRDLRDLLCQAVLRNEAELAQALFPQRGGNLRRLVDWSGGPVLRMTWYPSGEAGLVNHPHADIDLFTILPAATQPGLEIWAGDDWTRVDVGPSDVLVLPGEFSPHFGGAPSVQHRVMTNGASRMSASLFVNADPLLHVDGGVRVGEMFNARLAAVSKQN